PELRAPAPRARLAAGRHAHDGDPGVAPGPGLRRGRGGAEDQRRHGGVADARGAPPAARRHAAREAAAPPRAIRRAVARAQRARPADPGVSEEPRLELIS